MKSGYLELRFSVEPGQKFSFPTGFLYGHNGNQSLMKIEIKIIEISSKVLSKGKVHLSYPPLNYKRILEDNLRDLEESFIMVCMGLSLDSL